MYRHCFRGLALLVLLAPTGCAAMGARWAAYRECKVEHHAAKNEARQIELEALKQELALEQEAIRAHREAKLAALKAQREHELACLQEEADRSRQCMLNQTEESIRTTLGVGMDQRISLGQLQVNMDEMKRLMEERDAEYNYRMKLYEANQKAYRQQNPGDMAPYTAPSQCSSCGVPTSVCGCCPPPPSCAAQQPYQGPDCAGSQPYQAAPVKPYRAPVLPTEIPLMLPVKIEMRMNNVALGPSEVVRRPIPGMAPVNQQPVNSNCVPPAPPACGACKECQQGKACMAYAKPPVPPMANEAIGEEGLPPSSEETIQPAMLQYQSSDETVGDDAADTSFEDFLKQAENN